MLQGSASLPEAGARCGNAARRDLCGGWPVRAIPTATQVDVVERGDWVGLRVAFGWLVWLRWLVGAAFGKHGLPRSQMRGTLARVGASGLHARIGANSPRPAGTA